MDVEPSKTPCIYNSVRNIELIVYIYPKQCCNNNGCIMSHIETVPVPCPEIYTLFTNVNALYVSTLTVQYVS